MVGHAALDRRIGVRVPASQPSFARYPSLQRAKPRDTVKPLLVLDKDYLQGSKPAAIEQLCRDYCVLMPEALFFELLTCSAAVRASFAKFPAQDNPVALMPRVSELVRFEWKKRRPARPLYAHRLLKDPSGSMRDSLPASSSSPPVMSEG